MRYISLLIFIISGISVALGSEEARPFLRELDLVLENNDKYLRIKEQQLDSLRLNFRNSKGLREQFEREMELQGAFTSYSLDSANYHSHKALEIAEKIGDKTLISRAKIAIALIYNTSGVMYKEADELYRSIDPTLLSDSLKFSLLSLGVQLNRNLATHSLDKSLITLYNSRKKELRDSALILQPHNDVLLANRYIDSGNFAEAIEALSSQAPDGLHSRDAAVRYSILAQIYREQGNTEMEMKYLAQSAICDLTNGVREYLSLQRLAQLLYEEGDYDRAYRYIHRSIEDATACNAKLRMLEMAELLPVIDSAYDSIQKRSRTVLYITCLIIGLLSIALALVIIAIRRKNVTLRKNAATQTQLNSRLQASDRVKEEYVTRFMNLCLEYLAKMERYRNELNRIAAHRNFDELYDTIKSTRYIDKELADFYEKFDEAFLNLYPDFVTDINSRLKPECQYELKKSNKLNTELRIHALSRLGITDTDSICRFLRCSVSTVYNYKTKLRKAAI